MVHDTNIKMRMELEKEKEESRRLREILSTKKERVAQLERTLERGTSAMGGQMNDETQRLRTFVSWPHSEATHAGVTPRLLASDGFFFNPTAQDPDTVMCFFCDLQLGDWERSDDCKAVHRKLSPNCPHVLGLSCGNIARSQKAGSILPANATPQAVPPRPNTSLPFRRPLRPGSWNHDLIVLWHCAATRGHSRPQGHPAASGAAPPCDRAAARRLPAACQPPARVLRAWARGADDLACR